MALDRGNLIGTLTSPAGTLGVGLTVAITLALLPGRLSGSIRGAAGTLLRPGQVAASGLRRHGAQAATRIKSHFQTAARLAEAETELKRLRQENGRLAAELAATRGPPFGRCPVPGERAPRSRPSDATGDPGDDHARLLLARCVPARVLGRQARAFLGRHHLLDVGSQAGIEPGALVVDDSGLIDRGRDAGLAPGQLVLAGQQVWGKIVELGSQTSVVRSVAAAGYRDLVRLGDPRGPQGILEGTGEPLARVRLVEVTEPVAVGDPVYTAAGKGVLPGPLLYGRIVRLERPKGAADWEIWMQPAVAGEPERVAVLRTELNPLRVAEKGSGAGDQGSPIKE
jgi:cell shape-determining protein MreC